MTVVERVPQLTELEAIDLIEVGHSVWSRSRQTAREYPVGGLVWKVEPYADPETSEAHRRFHIIRGDDGRLLFDSVTSDDVDLATLSPKRFDLIRSTIRVVLTKQLMQRATKAWQREDQRLVEAQYELSKVLVPHG